MQRLTALVTVLTVLPVATTRADTAHVTADSSVTLSQPTLNGGTSPTLYVRNVGTGGVRRTFLRFDLGGLPANATIAKAKLRIWVALVESAGTVDVHPVNAPWSESTLTAANAPPLGSPASSLPISQNR
jgi:hypothetical protein